MDTINLAFTLCSYVMYLDLFSRLLGPGRMPEAFMVSLASTTITAVISLQLGEKQPTDSQ